MRNLLHTLLVLMKLLRSFDIVLLGVMELVPLGISSSEGVMTIVVMRSMVVPAIYIYIYIYIKRIY